MIFESRAQAGTLLAQALTSYADAVILAIPRGGVPVAYPIAQALSAPLDVCMVRKLGVPGSRELAMGAIASPHFVVLNRIVINACHISSKALERVLAREQQELARREALYRAGRAALEVAGRSVMLVDDGLATGATMLAAIRAVRVQRVASIIVVAPVGAPEACRVLEQYADAVICPFRPQPFYGVSDFYEDFPQIGDEEVQQLLSSAAR